MTAMKASDLTLYYNAVDILERNLLEGAKITALYRDERNLAFQEATNEVNQSRNALKKLGARIEDYVGILSLDGPAWVRSFFGNAKISGIWVSPVEVEGALISHEAVLECAVVGLPDRSNLIKPKAFVVLNEEYTASDALVQQLVEYCKEKIAAYKRPR